MRKSYTPYLKLSRILWERLAEANNRGVKIKLVYGKSELRSSERNQLDALTNIELLFLENLRAKYYLYSFFEVPGIKVGT